MSKHDTKIIDDYLAGMLNGRDTAIVEQAICEDDAYAERVYEQSREFTTLSRWARAEDQMDAIDAEVRRPAARRLKWPIAVVAITASIVLAMMWFRPAAEPARDNTFVLKSLGGEVFVDAGGTRRAAQRNSRIESNATIETTGRLSFATLVAADGTRVVISGDTVIRVELSDAKKIVVQRGMLSASVSPQPTGLPMVLETPESKLEVLGTEFVLEASDEHTDLRVTEGKVRVTRKLEGDSVVIVEGEQGLSDPFSPDLQVRKVTPTPDTFDVDFEDGDIASWSPGVLETEDLPDGSKGGVQATYYDKWNDWAIGSPQRRLDGWFVVRADSHLHLTFKMQRPEWLNLFLMVHTGDDEDPIDLLMCNQAPFRRAEAGKWYTMTIPLSKWQRNDEATGVYIDESPRPGESVYSLRFSSSAQDRGLIVDRVWVTRGGSGEYELELLNEGGYAHDE